MLDLPTVSWSELEGYTQSTQQIFVPLKHPVKCVIGCLLVASDGGSDLIGGYGTTDREQKRKQIEAIGGVEYLGRLVESVPSSANVIYYANILRMKMALILEK